MGGGQAGPIIPEARVVLVTRSDSGPLLALPRGVLGGRILLQLESSSHVQEGRRLPNPLVNI